MGCIQSSISSERFSDHNSCIYKASPYGIALGVVLLVAGIFLLLAAHKVFPNTSNPISDLSQYKNLWNVVLIGGICLAILGGIGSILRWVENSKDQDFSSQMQSNFCPNHDYLLMHLPQLKITRENVENATARLKDELKKTMITIEGSGDLSSKSAFDILQSMHKIHFSKKEFLDIEESASICAKGICNGLTQMQITSQYASPQEGLLRAQENIEEILCEQIKQNQLSLLNCFGSLRSTLYFAVELDEKTRQERRALKLHAAACTEQLFGIAYEELCGQHLDGSSLTQEEQEKYKRFSCHQTTLKEFQEIYAFYFNEGSVNGQLCIATAHTMGNLAYGHTLWFSCSSEGYYIQDSLNEAQGLFKFNDKETFISALFKQMKLYSAKCSKKSCFWMSKRQVKSASEVDSSIE